MGTYLQGKNPEKSTKIDATQTKMIPQYLYYNTRGYCWYCTHLVELNMMRSSGSPDNSPSMMVREWQVAIQVMKGPTSSMEGSSTTPQNLQETRIIFRGISLGSPSATTYGWILQNYGARDSHVPADYVQCSQCLTKYIITLLFRFIS